MDSLSFARACGYRARPTLAPPSKPHVSCVVRGDLAVKMTVALLMAFAVLGIAGVVSFFAQVIHQLPSETPLPTKKNALFRALWILLLSALMLAMLESESTGSDTLVCARSLLVGIGILILFAGYFIEQRFNQLIRKQEK